MLRLGRFFPCPSFLWRFTQAINILLPMQEKLKQQVLDAFLLVMRPIVRILLRYGIGYREFVEVAFKEIGVDIKWQGKGIDEKGINNKTGKVLVEVDEKYFRPAEVELLLGDATKAENELGWKRKISFQELVSGMVKYDLENDDFGGQE